MTGSQRQHKFTLTLFNRKKDGQNEPSFFFPRATINVATLMTAPISVRSHMYPDIPTAVP